jgi:hypothetical protein
MRTSVVLLALAVAGCASGSSAGGHAPAAGSTASGHASAAGSYASGHAPAAAPRYSPTLVSVQVTVPSRAMAAGSSMLAHIVVDNRTGHAIHAYGCGQLFELALESSSDPDQAAAWPACLQPLTIAAGETSYPWTITATYDGCGGTGNPPLPACLSGGGPPPLPDGMYWVVFFQSSNIVSAPAPIPVRVTPR